MPRAKKWFLAEADKEASNTDLPGPAGCHLVLKNADGLLKKPSASETLGRIKEVSKL